MKQILVLVINKIRMKILQKTILIQFTIVTSVYFIVYSEDEVKYFNKQYFKNKEYFKRKVDEDNPFNMTEKLYRKH